MQHGLSFFSPPPAPSPPRVAAPATAPLHAVPSTLLIPLAARARGDALFPHLACHDTEAQRQLAALNTRVDSYLADYPTVLNILWRTRRVRAAGEAFFARHPLAWGVSVPGMGRSLSVGLTVKF